MLAVTTARERSTLKLSPLVSMVVHSCVWKRSMPCSRKIAGDNVNAHLQIGASAG